MDAQRNPEHWLKIAEAEAKAAEQSGEQGPRPGRLKIFFGYAAGVGKTYTMLKAARAAQYRGVDVVAGYIEPHARPETMALAEGLETLPPLLCRQGGTGTDNAISLKEFDLDAALARKPALILIDELAHTNAPGCRHDKRYRDVEELLRAGIDVYSTVNVQHLESLNDQVAAITGITVRERIPDSVFDEAWQVELVDIEPQDLIERLKRGQVYRPAQAEQALDNFFSLENLTALREIALRRTADRVNRLAEKSRHKGSEAASDEHILVGLSSSPSNARIIRTGAKMAAAFRASFTALLVETSTAGEMSEANKARLEANIELARRLGAKIEVVQGDDIPFQIAAFARLAGVTKLVVGRSQAARRPFSKGTLTDRLIQNAPDLDLYIIPDQRRAKSYRAERHRSCERFSLADLAKTLGILLGALVLGQIVDHYGLGIANIITIFVLAVVLVAVSTASRVAALGSSLLAVLAFNFFFTEPRYTLWAFDKNMPLTFLIMFGAALLSSGLAVRLKHNADQSARSAFRTQLLFDSSLVLQAAESPEAIAKAVGQQLLKLLNRDVLVYLPADLAGEGEDAGADAVSATVQPAEASPSPANPVRPSSASSVSSDLAKTRDDALAYGGLLPPLFFPAGVESQREPCLSDNERAVAAWVYKNKTRAGAGTKTLPNSRCQYLAIRGKRAYGVVGYVAGSEALDPFQQSVLLSILGEAALALEAFEHGRAREAAAVLAQKEQLRANLLRAISHDLRTPLTAIAGGAEHLLDEGNRLTEAERRGIVESIGADARWLNAMVENLLAVTRLEEGRLALNLQPELLEDLIEEALRHAGKQGGGHRFKTELPEELLAAKVDAKLLLQVLLNLLDNAEKYTPPGSTITIGARNLGQTVELFVADEGPGIPDSEKERVFEMFYSGAKTLADSRRSLGLGLALCRSIAAAHGGTLTVRDRHPQGAEFALALPKAELPAV